MLYNKFNGCIDKLIKTIKWIGAILDKAEYWTIQKRLLYILNRKIYPEIFDAHILVEIM